MPPTRPTHSRATTSGASARPPQSAAATRGEHVVNRALAVHALLAAGRTPADVQRRLGKSKGYVSVLGYLGRALAGLEPEDLARLRAPALTPRVVWPLVTRARTDERAAVREALGATTTDAAREDARCRAHDRATVQLRTALRAHVQAVAAGLAAPPRARGGRRPRSVGPNEIATLAWDAAAWAADPVACARAHLKALAAAHQFVVTRAMTTTRQTGTDRVVAAHVAAAGGASLYRLTGERWRALADHARVAYSPSEREALALLSVVARAIQGVMSTSASAVRGTVDPPMDAELEADLAE